MAIDVKKAFDIPSPCVVHELPLVILMIAPLSPTAHAVLASMPITELSELLLYEFSPLQVIPPSVVFTMTPSSPTAHAVLLSTAVTEFSRRGVTLELL